MLIVELHMFNKNETIINAILQANMLKSLNPTKKIIFTLFSLASEEPLIFEFNFGEYQLDLKNILYNTIKAIYEKYHDKGLEIIGVSLDGNPKQKGAKDAWLDAIEKDNLTWYHVSNLQYFNDPIAKQFNISSIPATFIIDEEGLIVAKNLRGQALEDKIEELLN